MRPHGLPDDADEPDAVLTTPVPGIVIWRYPRRTVEVRHGDKRRTRTYSVTHEPSGFGLLGNRHTLRRDNALRAARLLGDVRWRGKPFDWTQDIAVIEANQRVRHACMYVAGFRIVSGAPFDKATREWAERNGIELGWKLTEATDAA